jgi:chromosome condensin MukBEF MukE localization factor
MGSDALIRAFNPKRRRYDERVAQKTVRARVGEAVRRLAGLGFADLVDDDQLRLRPALLRFAEPVRGLSEPAEALAQLVARGEIALDDDGAAGAEAVVDGEGDPADGEAGGDGDDDLDDEDKHRESEAPGGAQDHDEVAKQDPQSASDPSGGLAPQWRDDEEGEDGDDGDVP